MRTGQLKAMKASEIPFVVGVSPWYKAAYMKFSVYEQAVCAADQIYHRVHFNWKRKTSANHIIKHPWGLDSRCIAFSNISSITGPTFLPTSSEKRIKSFSSAEGDNPLYSKLDTRSPQVKEINHKPRLVTSTQNGKLDFLFQQGPHNLWHVQLGNRKCCEKLSLPSCMCDCITTTFNITLKEMATVYSTVSLAALALAATFRPHPRPQSGLISCRLLKCYIY